MTWQSNQLHDLIVYMEAGLVRHVIYPDTHRTTMHTGLKHDVAQRLNSQQAEPKYTMLNFLDHHVPN